MGRKKKLPIRLRQWQTAMKQEFPEIEETARLMTLFSEDKTLLQYKEMMPNQNLFMKQKATWPMLLFFNYLPIILLKEMPGTALKDPNTIVLSEEIAKKFFGNEPALNKIIHVNSNTNGEQDFKVTGVFRPIDKPSQIDARFFLSFAGGDVEQFMKSKPTW